ncbi:hypothetical protein MCOR27_005675 [Pyricularia oryzae]|uniref:Uncharacterized protein n=1 Tax=Pyricularia oryzae (strain P131) TaxID=1143193 RepID=L7JAU9_PYRO1|nr:hypothetical protein MCOR19_005490 [Pyricularia oryzae]KAI6264527.1 hypothetical protein MCOR26_011296 [Pyricularia oryzae]KAI6278259.1 hypothetical protein MCOR27_005675 [Pyricularia oryzae]KAI6305387.1 hypothetical protein MCOR34_008589 [Pyricularia oryzae]KAI6306044.1 hypothetical protein MCOR29_010265 [Pyricularia oryzae]
MRDGSLRFPVDLLSQLGHQSDKTRAGWCDGGQGVQVIDCIVIFGRPMRWCYKPSGATCWIDHASITAAAVTTRLATHNTNRFTVLRERSFRAWVAGTVIAAVSKLAPSCSQPTRHGPLSLKALVYGTPKYRLPCKSLHTSYEVHTLPYLAQQPAEQTAARNGRVFRMIA